MKARLMKNYLVIEEIVLNNNVQKQITNKVNVTFQVNRHPIVMKSKMMQ